MSLTPSSEVSCNRRRQFRIVRVFIGGLLGGITHTGIFDSPMPVGWVCEKPIGGSPYRIVECSEI